MGESVIYKAVKPQFGTKGFTDLTASSSNCGVSHGNTLAGFGQCKLHSLHATHIADLLSVVPDLLNSCDLVAH